LQELGSSARASRNRKSVYEKTPGAFLLRWLACPCFFSPISKLHSAKSFLALHDILKHLGYKEKISYECPETAAVFAGAGQFSNMITIKNTIPVKVAFIAKTELIW